MQGSDTREPWPAAAALVSTWLARRERIDDLLNGLPPGITGVDRARCQHLFYGAVRHAGRLDAAIDRVVARPPRFATRAALLVAGAELIEAISPRAGGVGEFAVTGDVARIVHHAVEQAKRFASAAEARLVNAVLRKLATALAAPPPPKLAPAVVVAEYFSHPTWLVERWFARFGADGTRKLLEWNQQPATVRVRWRSDAAPPDWLRPTPWTGFFEVPSGRWSEVEAMLRSGRAYVQDPGTRLAVDLLAPAPGETVLDACAAPGGKSLLIADRMERGRLVALDLPGNRISRLRENLSHVRGGVDARVLPADLIRDAGARLRAAGLPARFEAVLLDVPCSNTGVMRHRLDVKWRLQAGDFARHARQQLRMLVAASGLVAPGGRMVYSTCSIDADENAGVVEAFISRTDSRFELAGQLAELPWECGHDGAAAYLLRLRESG